MSHGAEAGGSAGEAEGERVRGGGRGPWDVKPGVAVRLMGPGTHFLLIYALGYTSLVTILFSHQLICGAPSERGYDEVEVGYLGVEGLPHLSGGVPLRNLCVLTLHLALGECCTPVE